MADQLVEIASWRIVAELIRRYPKRFRVIETHPGGGQYDCLTIIDSDERVVADFNRVGRLHFRKRADDAKILPSPLDIWPMMLGGTESKVVLDHVCKRMGLGIPGRLPPSTPQTIVYRLIAAFLSHSAFGAIRWECRNGFLDTSGFGCGVVERDFRRFPEACERVRVRMSDDLLGEPAYRFWFLRKEDVAELCLETSGFVWDRKGMQRNLVDDYKELRRISPLVTVIAGHLLP